MLIAVMQGCAQQDGVEQGLMEEKLTDTARGEVLALAETSTEVRNFVVGKGFDAEVELLSAETVKELALKSGTYAELPQKTLYRVNYHSETGGSYVAIVDLESRTVLKFFRIAGIRF